MADKDFKSQLDAESLKVFTEACEQPFATQAIFFLDAFWEEYGDQAEYMYAVAYHILRDIDMAGKGINYVHKYTEGTELDFDLTVAFYEKLCKFKNEPNASEFKKNFGDWVAKHKNFAEDGKGEDGYFGLSQPKMMTSIVRKKELRDKVDVNFSGKIGFLEYLLYQYKASPKDLITRHAKKDKEPEEIRKARLALEEVNKAIQAYEAERARLEEEMKKGGVKALRAKNELAQIDSGPLAETLNMKLIRAESALRIATKKYSKGGAGASADDAVDSGPSQGGIWWMNRDLAEKKAKYGRKK